jgi:predicted deacylase
MRKFRFRVFNFFFISSVALLLLGAYGEATAKSILGPQTSAITTNRLVQSQIRRNYSFQKSGIFVSSDFDGARLSSFTQTGDSTFTAEISPENIPVNDSAWYAFKIWAVAEKTVLVKLDYTYGKHRYIPKTSSDGIHWRIFTNDEVVKSKDGASATLRISIGPEPIYIAGQEIFTSANFNEWLGDLCKKPFVQSRVIGRSVLGKPIRCLEISEAGNDAEYLLILSRQHPPEVTGTFALKSFLNTIVAETPLAKAFRKKFKVIVVPLANPDGVDGGHWRHNANGVDLNRDWGQFHQPETRAIRDEFLRMNRESPGKVRFGLDFHSTQHDVFYTISGVNRSGTKGTNSGSDNLVKEWLAQIQSRVPHYKVKIEESKNKVQGTTLVSTAWMNEQLKIPAVTYEVGDETDRKLIANVAEVGATSLMKLLLEGRETASLQPKN